MNWFKLDRSYLIEAYLAYQKVFISSQSFGRARNAAIKKLKVPIYCTIKIIFIAVSEFRIKNYTATKNLETWCLYGAAQDKLLEEYAVEAGKFNSS